MSSLESTITFKRWDFRSEPCFSDVLAYPGLIVVGEHGLDGTKWSWFLLLIFLCLPLASWLFLVLTGLAVSVPPVNLIMIESLGSGCLCF